GRDGAHRAGPAPAAVAARRAFPRHGPGSATRGGNRFAGPARGRETRLMQKAGWVLAGVLLLGGCSSVSEWAEGDKTQYKNSGTLPPLEVPPDLTAPSRDSRY